MLACGLLVACGMPASVGASKLPKGVRSKAIEHEACDDGAGRRTEVQDLNRDGVPDIRRVFQGDLLLCSVADATRDGKPDSFEYYDAERRLRRRETDFDGNGIVNVIEYFEAGKIVRAELDLAGRGSIDTWDTFDAVTGKLVKRERDANGDGRPDEWWTYEGDAIRVQVDRNGDGEPDPNVSVSLGSPPPAPSAAADAGAAPSSARDGGRP